MNIAKRILSLIGRVLATSCAIYLGILGILQFEEGLKDPYEHILGFIYLLFAFLIILAVIPVLEIIKYFAILTQHVGLGGFMIFIGFLVFDSQKKLEFGCSMCFFSGGVSNIIIGMLM